MAHYKHAARYKRKEKGAESAAHLRRALEYLSFGAGVDPEDSEYDPTGPSYNGNPLDVYNEYNIRQRQPEYDINAPNYGPYDNLNREYRDEHADFWRLRSAENAAASTLLLENQERADLAADKLLREKQEREKHEREKHERANLAAGMLLREKHERANPRVYYKMRNPPIHFDFVHPLVNAWYVEKRNGKDTYINVYAEDTEATTYSNACGLAPSTIVMTLLTTTEVLVALADGISEFCIPIEREFTAEYVCGVVLSGDSAVRTRVIRLSGDGWTECDARTRGFVLDKELKRRRDWGYERLYVLDIPAYRSAVDVLQLSEHVPYPPLVNMWILNDTKPDRERTLTNVYAYDANQLGESTDEHGERRSGIAIPILLKSAYKFLRRANTQRRPIRIANVDTLQKMVTEGRESGHNEIVRSAIMAFLKQNATNNGGQLRMPPCFASLDHAFPGAKGETLVTITSIERNARGTGPDGTTKESFSFLGKWVEENKKKMVRVFTTDEEYMDAHIAERRGQEAKIEKDKTKLMLPKRRFLGPKTRLQ
jgi:hypothetical protein